MCSETKNMKLHVRPWNFQTLPELGHRRQSWSSKPLTDMFVTFLWGQTRICRASIFGVLRSSILTKDCLTDWVACAFAIWSNIKQPLWTLTCANIPNGINSIDLCSNFNAQMLLFAPCSPASTFGRMGTDSPLRRLEILAEIYRCTRKLWPVTCAKRLVFWFVRDCESVCFCGWPPFIAFKCPYTTQNMSTSLDTYMYLLTWLKQLI